MVADSTFRLGVTHSSFQAPPMSCLVQKVRLNGVTGVKKLPRGARVPFIILEPVLIQWKTLVIRQI